MLPEGILVSIVLPLRMILQFRQLGMWLESKRASNHAYLNGILVSNKKGARRQGSSKRKRLTRGQRLENQGLQAALKINARRQGTSKRIRFERGQRLDDQGLQAALKYKT